MTPFPISFLPDRDAMDTDKLALSFGMQVIREGLAKEMCEAVKGAPERWESYLPFADAALRHLGAFGMLPPLEVLPSPNGWIGVDLDGTLAYYDGYRVPDHIGDPIPAMAERVKAWLAQGEDVRIFTARVDGGLAAVAAGNPEGYKFADVARIRARIQDWTEQHFGVRLPVTNRKDYSMKALWDDRAVRVLLNSGHNCCDVN